MDLVFQDIPSWLEENDGRTSWMFKYVRFADGDVWFCDACTIIVSHKTIADSKPEVPAVYAGTIHVRNKQWRCKDCGSTTLKLPAGQSDEKYIDKILRPYGLFWGDFG